MSSVAASVLDVDDGHGPAIVEGSESLTEAEVATAELAEVQHIGRWLYDRSPGLRLVLGDVGEWPWLLEPNPPSAPGTTWLADADRDRGVLRAFAAIQASGAEPYAADDRGATLGLTADELDATLYRLVHGGLVSGGHLFTRSFVEVVTDKGMAAAGMLDANGKPFRVLSADLATFTSAGLGTLRIPAGVALEPGQTIAATDEGANTVEARVLAVTPDTAQVRVY